MPRRMLTIGTVVFALTLAGCAPWEGLLIDGGAPDHGQNASCMTVTELGREVAFGANLVNESDSDLTVTDVQLLAQNTVLVSEIAVADSGTDGSGWGVVTVDDLPSTLRDAWDSRTPAIGATIPAGESAWLLIVARTGGTREQTTGIHGVRVEFDGALWPRTTENDDYYGFIPVNGNCGAEPEASSNQ